MNKLSISNNEVLTMTSREIASLLNKNHSDIKRSAERLISSGVINNGQPLAECEFKTSRGNKFTEYLINKRDSLVLVAQNSPEFTAALVDRWQELEANQQPQIPQTKREWIEFALDQEKQLELAAPKVAFVDNFVESSGTKTFRQVAKILKANERLFRAFLSAEGFMYKIGREWTAYQKHIDAGRFSCTVGEKNGHAFTECKFTPKGIEYIAGKWITASST